MKVLLVRHAIAEERDEFSKSGKPDAERPLTREGTTKMRQIARALSDFLPELNLVASSPLTRAMQTARILVGAYSDVDMVSVDSLAPGGAHADTIKWMARHSNHHCVAVVGHEPGLGELMALLTTGRPDPIHEFKKGGLALLAFGGKPAAGGGKLEWLIPPAIARRGKA